MKPNLKFNVDGLIPAIIQQVPNAVHPYGRVLMMAWMNQEAIEASLKKGVMHYWSRSRKKLWLKGETSGHIQKIKQWFVDCDRDTLLFYVDQLGAACHTGYESCFFTQLNMNGQEMPVHEQIIFESADVYGIQKQAQAP